MGRKTLLIVILVIFLIIASTTNTQATVNGGNNPPWGGPMDPPCGFCYNDSDWDWDWYSYNDFITDATPELFERDVTIGAKGVQTCINLTVPSGCEINVTFQWLDTTTYYNDWMAWVDDQDWINWNINWSSEPTWDNNSYWLDYSSWTGVNSSTQLCQYNTNWSCRTENDWISEWDFWRVVLNITCGTSTFNITCYHCFQPELCPLSYIYPPSPNGTACPCCSPMCINISNEDGHPMNITIYRNDTLDENFYQVNKYLYISNGSYCFCIDGHINDSIYYPMQYDTVYHWYVNITDTVSDETSNSNIFRFRTEPDPDYCFCGNLTEALEEEGVLDYKTYIIGLLGLIGLAGFGWHRRRKK